MELLSENSKNIGSEELINPDQIKCPKCGAINKRINSKKPPEKRVYQCCKCKKYVKEKYQNKPQGLPISEEVSCANPDCLSKSVIRAGTNYEGKNRYKCKICKRKFVYQGTQVSAANYLSKDITPEEMYKMDCWDIRVLGLERSSNDLTYTVNFRAIKQDWLKEATKKWMKFCAGINSPSTLDSKMCAIRFFSNFLDIKYSTIQPQAINRDLVVEYLNYLLEKGLTVESRQPKISYLKEFLEYSARFDWIETTKETLVYDGDLPKRTKRLPRFIPQQILEKLDENLNLLPDCIARMIIVVRESGMRISELCHLNFDCIHQDVQGAWWLVYKRFKSKDEHTIPIRPQVAKVIQEQQQYIRENLGLKYPYLFCASENSRWIRDTTRNYTNKEVSKDMNLKDFQPISKLIHPTVVRGYLH